jgi:uncharacterized protein
MFHYLATEAIMRALAERFGEDADYWAMLGLLHDADWSLTKEDWSKHCIISADILREKGFDEMFIEQVQSHGYGYEQIPALAGKKRNSRIEHCLIAAETLTGIIYAYALMRGRKISDMDAAGLKKKFKDKKFAANCNRELVKEIESAELSLSEFFEISIRELTKIKDTINLQ